jgi:small subunit ribosomal protein S14
MAKKSVEARNSKREAKSVRCEERREALRQLIKAGGEEGQLAALQLQKRPRNESKCRVTRRCSDCGRARGNYRKFSLCRICIRNFLALGFIPGLRKSSW